MPDDNEPEEPTEEELDRFLNRNTSPPPFENLDGGLPQAWHYRNGHTS